MQFSTDTEKFLSSSRQAYEKFQHHQTPFTAVKIYFSGLEGERARIDDIVGNNFRSEKDAILKSENNYAILMHNTSLKAAEAVVNRISVKLSRLSYGFENTTKKPSLNAYACLYGAGEGRAKLHFRHLELIKPLKKREDAEKLQPKIRDYLKWRESLKKKGYKAFSIKA